MRPILFLAVLTALAFPAFSQTPQTGFTYEDRSGTTGHTIVVDGKSYGPYKDFQKMVYSTHGQAGLFLVTKRDKTYILAQGKESGPLPQGYIEDRTWISDDGQFWALAAFQENDGEEEGGSQTQLWVNGKAYGPFYSVENLDNAETGGAWIASVQTTEGLYSVLLNGKSQGTFHSVDTLWMSPDGKLWGFAGTGNDDQPVAVTQDQKFLGVQEVNFSSMDPRAPHWAYSVRTGDETETIVVDGKTLTGYLHFRDFVVTDSGKHWGFAADKLTDTGDFPVVVVNGKEFVGEGLSADRQGTQEFFTWTIQDGAKTSVQLLNLP